MPFPQLENESYISLKTYRKNGEGVATPVWFAENDGKLYIITVHTTGKVKRIRNNPQVEVAACDGRGQLKDGAEYVTAQATILPETQNSYADGILLKKYGLLKRFFAFLGKLRGAKYVYLEISR